jgi:hypothetical protein
LLTQQQAEVSSVAVANARMRALGQELVVGRQLIKTPYINPQDNRMLPNTVEGVGLMRRRDEAQTLDYGVAPGNVRALTEIKGVRDITSGVVVLTVWAGAGTTALGWALTAAAPRSTT